MVGLLFPVYVNLNRVLVHGWFTFLPILDIDMYVFQPNYVSKLEQVTKG